MGKKKSSTTADILNLLMDGKMYTMKKIAELVECHPNTVQRHIQSLAYTYPIETFVGGEKKGGVWLDKSYIAQGRVFKRSELQFGAKIFGALQRTDFNEEDQKSLDVFLKLFATQLNQIKGD